MIKSDELRTVEPGPEAPRSRLRLYLGIGLTLCLVAVGLFLSRGGEEAAVEELRRNVQAGRDGGAFVSVRQQPGVGVGDAVRTDTTGRGQIDYPDGSMTRLGPDTIFVLDELRSGTERVVKGRVDLGRTLHRVEKLVSTEDRFEVSTQNAVATVVGTVFMVECDVSQVPRDPNAPTFPLPPQECDTETVAVSEGTVSWYSGGQEKTLEASECSTKRGDRPGGLGPCKYSDEELEEIFKSLGDDSTFPAARRGAPGQGQGTPAPGPAGPGTSAAGPPPGTNEDPPSSDSDRPATPAQADEPAQKEDKKDKPKDKDDKDRGPRDEPAPPTEPNEPSEPGNPGNPDEPGNGNEEEDDDTDDGNECVDLGKGKCKGEQIGGGPPEDKGKPKDKDDDEDDGKGGPPPNKGKP